MRLYTYTLRINTTVEGGGLIADEIEALQGAIQDAENVVNDALPEGYYCKIEDTDRLEEASKNAADYFGVGR